MEAFLIWLGSTRITSDVFQAFSCSRSPSNSVVHVLFAIVFLQVEYFLKEHFDTLGLGAHKEFIHFALTSQDVNNVAQPLMLRDAIQQSYLPTLKKFIKEVRKTKRKRKRITRFSFTFILAGERQSTCVRTCAYAFCSYHKYIASIKHSPLHFTAFFWCACV